MSLSCSASASFVFATASLALVGIGVALFALFPAGRDEGGISLTAFFNSSSLRFFFSCFARSSAFVSLVNAIDFPSGDQTGLPVLFGKSVNENESPPAIGKIDNCCGSGLPSFSVARRKSRYFPSGDQRGVESCSPLVN